MALTELTYREFNHASGRVLDEIEATGQPVVIRRRGRQDMLIMPFTESGLEDQLSRLIRHGLARPASATAAIDWPHVDRVAPAELDAVLDEMDD